ncbi:MAG: MarR family transcriptional regulator, partial [Gemmatimonadetes bacterium]|nr:MarR family transcriptional regulator [Gemmatimonadota bacterium]
MLSLTLHPLGSLLRAAGLLVEIMSVYRWKRALLALAEAAPMRSLAGQLRCDASNVTGLADRLEVRGLVTRVGQQGDRRVKLLALTDAGRALRDEAVTINQEMIGAIGFDSREFDDLKSRLRALI